MSEDFSAEWLRLREPCDERSRSTILADRLAGWCADRGAIRVVDLGAGTGSNLRWTAPWLHVEQDWTLIEHDPALIAAGQTELAGLRVPWVYRQLDLAAGIERLADQRVDLITASALIDLISASWLERLLRVRQCLKAALYLVLSYDGEIAWEPMDHFDATAAALVNRHQRIDKGFGPALGPMAIDELQVRLSPEDGAVCTEPSTWPLGPEDARMQRALLAGYKAAGAQVGNGGGAEIDAWARRRGMMIDAGRSKLSVGHRDLLLLPD